MMENIAILTGGDSAEYNISLLSANTVLKNLNKLKYRAFIVHLKENKFQVLLNENKVTIDKSEFSFQLDGVKIFFNKVFMALHGPPAENGLIQDYFDKLRIPYTSCNSSISALTFDKYECNKKLTELEFDCAKSIILNSDDLIDEEEIITSIKLPCFVKPNGAGSSFGVSKVNTKKELVPAINDAFKHDKKVLIESFIDGTEISCGVYFDGTKINALPITEIVTENEFFDYEAKYDGKANEITPARISKSLTVAVQKTTIDIYKRIKLSGICRIDYIIMNNKPFIIEINTIPGLSRESIIPQQLIAAKISLSKVFDLCLNNLN
jgi:D-alanine-D-alanine ligase